MTSNDIDGHCTHAITGNQETFQAIYVCRDCSEAISQAELCVCQACADNCHAGHEGLEFICMGLSYCDCIQMGCRIEKISREKADELGVTTTGSIGQSCKETESNDAKKEYTIENFHVSCLENSDLNELLCQEANALVKQSKETFWLQEPIDTSQLSLLESMAWAVYQHHMKHYNLFDDGRVQGCEWWVQVKNVSPLNEEQSLLESKGSGGEAIDLHYDKDEALAEAFGIGAFPKYSTVTYLTDSRAAPPTVVFPHRYDQGDGEIVSKMIISRPKQAKHLLFDGRLLHGAPAHYALRQMGVDEGSSSLVRITFPVNMWIGHKPASVNVLPESIRKALPQIGSEFKDEILQTVFRKDNICRWELNEENDLPESHRGRIEIPFLGSTTTWGDAEGDNEVSTVVVCFPPPPEMLDDTVMVCFGPGMQAYLEDISVDQDQGIERIEAKVDQIYV